MYLEARAYSARGSGKNNEVGKRSSAIMSVYLDEPKWGICETSSDAVQCALSTCAHLVR